MLVIQQNQTIYKIESVTIDDIKNESFMMYRQDISLYDQISDVCTSHNFFPKIVCESSQKDFMIEMVEANLGVALLPRQICEKITSTKVATIPFEQPDIFLELGVIWKKDNYLPYAVREFIDIVK